MILAEKITMLRKQNGWSQEELATKLNISRQSVSKWESTASVPDLDKIIKLSEIFGVSTDFLLKDDMEDAIIPAGADYVEEPIRNVSLDEANNFMELTARFSKWIAFGVMLCILSPVLLIVLIEMSAYGFIPLSENTAVGLGMIILLIMVAAAVAIFILKGMQLSRYEYLEKEDFALEYGVSGIVEKRKHDFENTFRTCIAIGVVLCILGVVPLFLTQLFPGFYLLEILSIGLLLTMAACGVFLFVWSGMIQGSFQKLLQVEDYSTRNKKVNKKIEPFSGFYWCLITAIYLGWSFLTNDWNKTWIIWPCAGVLFGAISCIMHVILKEK